MPLDPCLEMIQGAEPAAAQSFRAGAARRLNRWAKMLHYATVFAIISLTMVIMGFGSMLASLWSDKD